MELKPNEQGDKNLWRVTRSIKRPSARFPPLKDNSGGWVKTNKEKVDLFAEHFEHQFTPFPNNSPSIDDDIPFFQYEGRISHFKLDELKEEIKHLNIKKAPGEDKVTGKLIKALPSNAIHLLLFIYNAILRLGHFPSIWKLSRIIVIPKPGKPEEEITSYRPISLISIFSKTFERLFKKKLIPFVKLPHHQFGFRSGHGSVEQCHRFVHHIQTALQEKKFCCGAFLDIQQAFDRVWHEGLIIKLKGSVPMPLFLVLKSYITDRKFKVAYGGEESDWKPIKAGVPQGSVLGPLLYTIYTSDMDVDEASLLGTFADDTGFLCTDKELDVARMKLLECLRQYEEWASKWRLKISAPKSKIITFTLRRESPQTPMFINNEQIPEVASVKYLGLTIDKKLNFREHIEKKIKHVNITISKMDWLVGRKSKLSIENKLIIYKTIILPLLGYCCVIWGAASNTNIKKVQTVQNKFLRKAINAPWYVSNATNHKDLNIIYINEYINNFVNRYKNRLSNHENLLISEMNQTTIPRRLSRRVLLDPLE